MNKRFFGIDCPGCGIQRAIMFILKGDFDAALHIFPAIYPMMLLFILLGLNLLDKSRNYSKLIIAMAISTGLVILISYIYKLTNI